MLQDWSNLTFLHWRFPPAIIAQQIPAPLELDTFDGSAWVAITPFWLSGLRPPILPALPWLSNFPETNCRTYVRGPDGDTGVWFWSLDASRAFAVAAARLGYGLPYAWSRMRVTTAGSRIRYESRRRWPDRSAMTRIEVERGHSIEAGKLEDFLTRAVPTLLFHRGQTDLHTGAARALALGGGKNYDAGADAHGRGRNSRAGRSPTRALFAGCSGSRLTTAPRAGSLPSECSPSGVALVCRWPGGLEKSSSIGANGMAASATPLGCGNSFRQSPCSFCLLVTGNRQ